MSDYQTIANKRIPVTILTGFLGSGKTTLLNQLIEKHKHTTRFAIIENEYGETGIDGSLLGTDGMPVYELTDGCICCSCNEDFYKSLLSILDNSQGINHLLVETTGVADPMSVIDLFVSNELIIRNFQIDSVICITDAGNLEDMLGIEPEARKQIALSDTILLNKMDVVRKDRAASLHELISAINPMAKVIETSYGYTNGTPLLHTYAYSQKHVEETTLYFNSLSIEYDNINGAFDSALKRGKERRHDIYAEGFEFEEYFDPEMFNIWMSSFLYFNQSTLYRVKGILNFKGKNRRCIFQAVKGSYLFEEGNQWEDEEQRFSKIVFIGKYLNRKDLECNLRNLFAKKALP